MRCFWSYLTFTSFSGGRRRHKWNGKCFHFEPHWDFKFPKSFFSALARFAPVDSTRRRKIISLKTSFLAWRNFLSNKRRKGKLLFIFIHLGILGPLLRRDSELGRVFKWSDNTLSTCEFFYLEALANQLAIVRNRTIIHLKLFQCVIITKYLLTTSLSDFLLAELFPFISSSQFPFGWHRK